MAVDCKIPSMRECQEDDQIAHLNRDHRFGFAVEAGNFLADQALKDHELAY